MNYCKTCQSLLFCQSSIAAEQCQTCRTQAEYTALFAYAEVDIAATNDLIGKQNAADPNFGRLPETPKGDFLRLVAAWEHGATLSALGNSNLDGFEKFDPELIAARRKVHAPVADAAAIIAKRRERR